MSTPQQAFDPRAADTPEVSQWLMTGLDGYIKDDIGRWAFRPCEQHIGKSDDLAEDLSGLYASLTAAAQVRWRNAIRDLLATYGRDVQKRQAVRVLIDFAVLIRSPEALEVLPGVLAGPGDETLFNLVVRAAVALASQTEASRNCLERIRTSPAFTSDYAGLILVSLCHVDPDNWLHHVHKLEDPMRRLTSDLSPDSTALRFYARNILDAISLSRITEADLEQLPVQTDGEPCWLYREWIEGDDSLLYIRHDSPDAPLAFRGDNAVSTDIEGAHDTSLFDPYLGHESQRVVVKWERIGSKRMWVAVCVGGRLKELTRIELSAEALMKTLRKYPSFEGSFECPTPLPRRGGVVTTAVHTSPKVSIDDERGAAWKKMVINRTDRIQYLNQYDSHRLNWPFHLLAIEYEKAFRATASALAA